MADMPFVRGTQSSDRTFAFAVNGADVTSSQPDYHGLSNVRRTARGRAPPPPLSPVFSANRAEPVSP